MITLMPKQTEEVNKYLYIPSYKNHRFTNTNDLGRYKNEQNICLTQCSEILLCNTLPLLGLKRIYRLLNKSPKLNSEMNTNPQTKA